LLFATGRYDGPLLNQCIKNSFRQKMYFKDLIRALFFSAALLTFH